MVPYPQGGMIAMWEKFKERKRRKYGSYGKWLEHVGDVVFVVATLWVLVTLVLTAFWPKLG